MSNNCSFGCVSDIDLDSSLYCVLHFNSVIGVVAGGRVHVVTTLKETSVTTPPCGRCDYVMSSDKSTIKIVQIRPEVVGHVLRHV